MDREQGRRFDAFSSAVIPKAAIKKVGFPAILGVPPELS